MIKVIDFGFHWEATKEYLGGKGYGLYRMNEYGVRVPPAIVIPTPMCVEYMARPKMTMKKVAAKYKEIKKVFTDYFGYMPLVSVRSGARVSMPGMMDTILNVGIDEDSINFWREKLGDVAFEDSYKRLVTMYGNVVHGIDRHQLESGDSAHALEVFKSVTGNEFPDAKEQLISSIEAVFRSWNNERAKFYRKMNNIPEDWGTAVVIQAMVFGNLNDNSCTGVMFSRNPDTGENKVVGEFLVNAQGEDVVAGIRTPQSIDRMAEWNPSVASQVLEVASILESKAKDVQDIEFTVQDGELFILQTRNAKRTPLAAVRIAVDMYDEGVISLEEAVNRISLRDLDLCNQVVIDPSFKAAPDFVGIPACSGVVSGIPVFSAADAINCTEPCILITEETTPDDIAGMAAAVGVITMKGGSTSHAAVVARGMNKPCVVGVGANISDFGTLVVSFNGSTGEIWKQKVPVVSGENSPYVSKFKKMVFEFAKTKYNIVPLVGGECGSNQVIIDLSGEIYRGQDWLFEEIKNVVDFGYDKVFVDFGYMTAAQSFYNALFLSNTFSFSDVINRVVDRVVHSGFADKVVFVVNSSYKSTITKLEQGGHNFIVCTDYLHELIRANDEVVWGGVIDDVVAKVINWQIASNVRVSALGGFTTYGTSYVSDKQILALLLK